MVHNEFPRLHQPALQSREVLRMLRYRQKLIKVRTMTKNSLQAIALQAGLAKGSRLFTTDGQQEFKHGRDVSGLAMATRPLVATC